MLMRRQVGLLRPILCREFAAAVDECDVSSFDTVGSLYTWIGRLSLEMIQVWLDRALCSNTCFNFW